MCCGVQQNDSSWLKIKAFFLRLTEPVARKTVPDSVTLCYLPRINGSPLEINGSWIRPDCPGFLTLHRVVEGGSVVFGSRERVRLSEGARFAVYLGEDKLLTGIFRRDDGDEWNMDVKCVLEREVGVREAEVCVAVEGGAGAMIERVEVVANSNYRSRNNKYCFRKLEEIPEQREGEVAESDGCYCFEEGSDDEEIGSDGGDEVDLDFGTKWALDVGIWVMCFGVGYLVSKASSKSLRRKTLLS